jgi:hypothetical protein
MQYGTGTAMMGDQSVWVAAGDRQRDYKRGKLQFQLVGEKLCSGWVLV